MLKKIISSILKWPLLLLGSTQITVYYFSVRIFFLYDNLKIHMFLLAFCRKWTALVLCKLIESAIQRFQIHHKITFATIQNPAVYLLGARVSIFPTLVLRLKRKYKSIFQTSSAPPKLILLNVSMCSHTSHDVFEKLIRTWGRYPTALNVASGEPGH